MSTWTPDRSALLSLLLDEVTGSQEAIAIRQDYCGIRDLIHSAYDNVYYTGSKSEGLDLPDSDNDFMQDVNNFYNIKVVQSLEDSSDTSLYKFVLCTENVKPGFVLLRCGRQTPTHGTLYLLPCIQSINNERYLSSNLFVNSWFTGISSARKSEFIKIARQGPSIEIWQDYQDTSQSGTDRVYSIHCEFWPHDASEWIHRPREFGWPTSRDISSIVDFGCHLVPVGHPHSEFKLIEWRISFSLAERTLVWTFNHVQMQCYAVLKIVLKEFIKKKCSEQNQVLCSYFIKTFLFWKFETTALDFWNENNFRECINYLLAEFSDCIRKGVLRHYFLRKFNLFSVKFTQEAQSELLQLFDIIAQLNISILRECSTLQNVWANFLTANQNQMNVIHNSRRASLLNDDELLMTEMTELNIDIDQIYARHQDYSKLFGDSPLLKKYRFSLGHLMKVPCKSHLKSFLTKQLLLEKQIMPIVELSNSENKKISLLLDIGNESTSCDLSTSKHWHAIVLMRKGFYALPLKIVNQVLSSIPPFVLYDGVYQRNTFDSKRLYVDKFLNSSCTTMQRAQESWLMPLVISKCVTEILPLAFQIEQYFVDNNTISLCIPPYICAFYLKFQCHHELGQYGHRDRVLQQLIDHLMDIIIKGVCNLYVYHSFNIAGHCLWITGQIERAREMFYISSELTKQYSRAEDKQNSAKWYIENLCATGHR